MRKNMTNTLHNTNTMTFPFNVQVSEMLHCSFKSQFSSFNVLASTRSKSLQVRKVQLCHHIQEIHHSNQYLHSIIMVKKQKRI